jgi:hypothetical protein
MAQWTRTEIRRMIVDAIAPVVSAAGFRLKQAPEAFVREIEGGGQKLGLSMVEYNADVHFGFYLCVRLNAVEEISNRFCGWPAGAPTNSTSYTRLEFLGLPAYFEVSSEAELAATMPNIVTMVRERILPFFDEYRDVAAVNRGLNP